MRNRYIHLGAILGGGKGGWSEEQARRRKLKDREGEGIAARTILLFHIIQVSARPPKQPLFFFTRPRLADALGCRGY